MSRLRDRRGRFTKAPKAKPLPDELVKGLREGAPAYEDWSKIPIALVISERSRALPKRPWKVVRQGIIVDEK